MTDKQRAGYVPALDGLRALAVFAVICLHNHLSFMPGGAIGVTVFFALSGYLITTLLLREHDRTGNVSLRRFYGRRAARLFPALALMLSVTLVWTFVQAKGDFRHQTLVGVVASALYAGNWVRAFTPDGLGALAHTWSLSVEEQFYLVWPLALVWACRRGRRTVLAVALALSLGALLMRALLWSGPDSFNRVYNGTDTVADQLLIGCALAVAVQLWPEVSRRILRVSVAPAASVLIFVAFHGLYSSRLNYTLGYTLLSLCSAVVVGFFATSRSWVSRVLAWEPLRLTGLISYGMYLWHFPLIAMLAGAHIIGNERVVLDIAGSYGLAALSYVAVEMPVRRWVLGRSARRTSDLRPVFPLVNDLEEPAVAMSA